MRRKITVWIFQETNSRNFNREDLNMAKEGKVTVIPVVICALGTINRKTEFLQIAIQKKTEFLQIAIQKKLNFFK